MSKIIIITSRVESYRFFSQSLRKYRYIISPLQIILHHLTIIFHTPFFGQFVNFLAVF